MFVGPLFAREVLTAPRPFRHYFLRAGYVGGLFVLMYTAAQTTFGWQQARNLGDIARFSTLVFQILSYVQLVLMLFFSVLFAAGHIAQEKDRRTLILLLMTDLRDRELVLGKLFASLLLPGILWLCSLPVFGVLKLLGGVADDQLIAGAMVSLCAALLGGAWGNLVAYWRDKTYQTLAISLLGVVGFLAVIEIVTQLTSGSVVSDIVGLFNPFRTLARVLDPLHASTGTGWSYTTVAAISCGALALLAVALATFTTVMVRVWNPSRALSEAAKSSEAKQREVARPPRVVWEQPVLWREMRTRAYGNRASLIKLAYAALALVAMWALARSGETGLVLGMITPTGFVFVGLGLLSMLLINTQAVTSLTTERDANTLELLLVTELSAKEFVYGKLLGVFYNAKEVIAIPIIMLTLFGLQGQFSFEIYAYVVLGYLALCVFAAMLGIHFGLTYGSSRSAIATSLGTMFFLFIGILICMILILQAGSSFGLQLPSFLVFILGGSLGLWGALTHRNPSAALTLAAGLLPFCTFYAITSYLLGQTLGVAIFVLLAYGFTTVAMLVPAISEFDVALGRSGGDKD